MNPKAPVIRPEEPQSGTLFYLILEELLSLDPLGAQISGS